MSFATRLKERREELNLTQAELGHLLGIRGSAISNYEIGVSSPKADVLYKVFDVLKCDANFLFQDEMKTKKAPPVSGEAMRLARDYDSLDDAGRHTVRVVTDAELLRLEISASEKNSEVG